MDTMAIRHGTYAAYQWHTHFTCEPPCGPCKRAAREYQRARRQRVKAGRCHMGAVVAPAGFERTGLGWPV